MSYMNLDWFEGLMSSVIMLILKIAWKPIKSFLNVYQILENDSLICGGSKVWSNAQDLRLTLWAPICKWAILSFSRFVGSNPIPHIILFKMVIMFVSLLSFSGRLMNGVCKRLFCEFLEQFILFVKKLCCFPLDFSLMAFKPFGKI